MTIHENVENTRVGVTRGQIMYVLPNSRHFHRRLHHPCTHTHIPAPISACFPFHSQFVRPECNERILPLCRLDCSPSAISGHVMPYLAHSLVLYTVAASVAQRHVFALNMCLCCVLGSSNPGSRIYNFDFGRSSRPAAASTKISYTTFSFFFFSFFLYVT